MTIKPWRQLLPLLICLCLQNKGCVTADGVTEDMCKPGDINWTLNAIQLHVKLGQKATLEWRYETPEKIIEVLFYRYNTHRYEILQRLKSSKMKRKIGRMEFDARKFQTRYWAFVSISNIMLQDTMYDYNIRVTLQSGCHDNGTSTTIKTDTIPIPEVLTTERERIIDGGDTVVSTEQDTSIVSRKSMTTRIWITYNTIPWTTYNTTPSESSTLLSSTNIMLICILSLLVLAILTPCLRRWIITRKRTMISPRIENEYESSLPPTPPRTQYYSIDEDEMYSDDDGATAIPMNTLVSVSDPAHAVTSQTVAVSVHNPAQPMSSQAVAVSVHSSDQPMTSQTVAVSVPNPAQPITSQTVAVSVANAAQPITSQPVTSQLGSVRRTGNIYENQEILEASKVVKTHTYVNETSLVGPTQQGTNTLVTTSSPNNQNQAGTSASGGASASGGTSLARHVMEALSAPRRKDDEDSMYLTVIPEPTQPQQGTKTLATMTSPNSQNQAGTSASGGASVSGGASRARLVTEALSAPRRKDADLKVIPEPTETENP